MTRRWPSGVPVALTIAGSDSGGGAGIQADLKTFSALGVYGASALTALTAQNTQGVQAVLAIDAAFVRRQIDSVFADLRIDAVKIGMLGDPDIVLAVADGLRAWQPPNVVLDPVMVAKGGDRLLWAEAVAAVRERLLPLADLTTPNLPEAAALLGSAAPRDRSGMVAAAGGRSSMCVAVQAPVMRLPRERALEVLPALQRAAQALAAIDSTPAKARRA